jgi:hypothetical protein
VTSGAPGAAACVMADSRLVLPPVLHDVSFASRVK